jgi:hypothetical protein
VKPVSFDDPFFDEISKYAVRFAMPVFFGASPHQSYSAFLRNGTVTLLRLGSRFLGVTCYHVLDGFRQLPSSQRGIFQLGPIVMEPENHLIAEDRERDIAVIDLTSFVGTSTGLREPNFVEPLSWPPADLSTDDVICLGGFPGIWRDQVDLGHLRFYSFSSGASEVTSVREDVIVTRVRVEVWGSLGGLSGGPVFAWRKTPILVAELVGFVYEYQESLDLMFVRSAAVLSEEGRILPHARGL